MTAQLSLPETPPTAPANNAQRSEIARECLTVAPALSRFEYLLDVTERLVSQGDLSRVSGVTQELRENTSDARQALEYLKDVAKECIHPHDAAEVHALLEQSVRYSEAFHVAQILHQYEVLSPEQMARLERWVEVLHDVSLKTLHLVLDRISVSDQHRDKLASALFQLVDPLSICELSSPIVFRPGAACLPQQHDEFPFEALPYDYFVRNRGCSRGVSSND
jgi:hypothetical protein